MLQLPSDPGANQCWGYFSAVQQYATLTNNNTRITATCPPASVTLTQIVQAFLEYAKANPKQLGGYPATVAYEMMHQNRR